MSEEVHELVDRLVRSDAAALVGPAGCWLMVLVAKAGGRDGVVLKTGELADRLGLTCPALTRARKKCVADGLLACVELKGARVLYRIVNPAAPAPERAALVPAAPAPKKERPRNPVFDAIAEVTGRDPATAGSVIGKVAATLGKADPPYTPDEVREFGRRFWDLCPWAKNDGRERPTPTELGSHIGLVRAGSVPQPVRIEDKRDAHAARTLLDAMGM